MLHGSVDNLVRLVSLLMVIASINQEIDVRLLHCFDEKEAVTDTKAKMGGREGGGLLLCARKIPVIFFMLHYQVEFLFLFLGVFSF